MHHLDRLALSGSVFLLGSLALWGCGDDGTPLDTGVAPDSGPVADTGTPGDSGVDTGPVGDSGAPGDSGSPGDSGASRDSAVAFPDGGAGDPPWVEMTLGPAGTCDAFSSCPGEIVGIWETSGVCFEDDFEDTISRCPGAAVTGRTGRARGRVVFGADGFAIRAAESEVEYEIFYPALCAAVFSCAMVEAAIAPFVDTVSCPVDGTGDCTCTAALRTTIMDRDAYRTELGQIISVTSGKRWDYCVAGETLTYRDTDTSAAGEPGIVELTRL